MAPPSRTSAGLRRENSVDSYNLDDHVYATATRCGVQDGYTCRDGRLTLHACDIVVLEVEGTDLIQ